MGVTFEGAAVNNGKNTHLSVIVHAKIGLRDLKNCNWFEKGKRMGTKYAEYSRQLHNLYHSTYEHLNTLHTQMLPSWECASSAASLTFFCVWIFMHWIFDNLSGSQNMQNIGPDMQLYEKWYVETVL